MKIAITGHRPNKLGNDYDLTSHLLINIKHKINSIIAEDYWYYPAELECFITGMALGIDTLFAKIAVENNVPFIAAIPCLEQDSKWFYDSKVLYNELINHKLCTKIIVSNELYNDKCMQIRNEWMVDNCDVLIAVWDGTNGGTANCVRYAESKNKKIIRIDPKDFK